MAFPERRTVDTLLTTALLAAVAVGVYCARRVILTFVFAILFSYLLEPVVKFLQRGSKRSLRVVLEKGSPSLVGCNSGTSEGELRVP